MNQKETKQCQNCKQQFTIEPEDFDFYKKIDVPPPTWCPECRTVRRMNWRNERALYRRKCTAPRHSEEIVSIFSPDSPFQVYDQKLWWSDNWDQLENGADYDFSRPFFEQFRELLENTPMLAVFNGNAVNSDYCNHAFDSKNCYLLSASFENENVAYSNRASRCKDSLDLYMVDESELCYNSLLSAKCSRLFFGAKCVNCIDSYFLYDCHNCSNCVGCVNLRNKQYHLFNRPYSKEEYFKKLGDLDLENSSGLSKIKSDFDELSRSALHKYANTIKVVNSSGDNLYETKSCKYCFDVGGNVENSSYCVWGGYGMKDSRDGLGVGIGELIYEAVDTGGVSGASSRNLFTIVSWNSSDVQYSYNCHSCSNLFGCIGLRSKQYCVLNKQYTKAEYEELVPRIIKQMSDTPYMDKNGRVYKYSEFFPPELSPFAYNETIAQEYFPLTREEAKERGYRWKEPEARRYKTTKNSSDLPDRIKKVSDSILNEVIGCAHEGKCDEQCTAAFKIIPQELQFYRRMNLPLPRLCPNCRHYQRLKQRNPLKLWHRKCTCAGTKSGNSVHKNTATHSHGSSPCPSEFKTAYSPDRKEIVYCESCYNSEVA